MKKPSGYTWNFVVHCGKMDPIGGLDHSETVVIKLTEKHLDVGRVNILDH